MSSRMRSGRSCFTSLIASSADSPMPTTWRSGSSASVSLTPRRNMGWSSTITIRILLADDDFLMLHPAQVKAGHKTCASSRVRTYCQVAANAFYPRAQSCQTEAFLQGPIRGESRSTVQDFDFKFVCCARGHTLAHSAGMTKGVRQSLLYETVDADFQGFGDVLGKAVKVA